MITFSGDLIAKLQELAARKLREIERKAVNAGSQVLVQEIRSRARAIAYTGATARSIGKKVKIFRSSGTAIGIVGPRSGWTKEFPRGRRGKLFKRQPSKTAHLVERGTFRSRPRPFLEPAIADAGGRAFAAMEAKAAEELSK